MAKRQLRVLIVGLGSIGRRHLANLPRAAPEASPVVWRIKGASPDDCGSVPVVRTLEAALAMQPDAAIVTCPASLHAEIGIALAGAGVPLLVEKPLADCTRAGRELVECCRQTGVLLMVGYNLRFYPPIRALRDAVDRGVVGRLLSLRGEVGQHLADWRRNVDYRDTVSARKSLGGGAVLELSHEIDYARWIAGEISQVSACLASLGGFDVDVEDTAEIICRFESGALGSLHLDMVQRPARRVCRLVGTLGVIDWDRANHEVVLTRTDGARQILHPAGALESNDVYVDELKHFLAALSTGSEPLITGDDALKTLMVADAIKRSAREGRTVEL